MYFITSKNGFTHNPETIYCTAYYILPHDKYVTATSFGITVQYLASLLFNYIKIFNHYLKPRRAIKRILEI